MSAPVPAQPSLPAITDFSAMTTAPVYDQPRPDRLVSGNPRRTTWNHFTSSSGEVDAGIWACEVGSWRIAFPDNKDEFFFVTEGRCRLVDQHGHAVEAGPGNALVIPAGFHGTFEVLEPVKKHYVIVERKA